MLPVVLKYKMKNKQTNVEHNFVKQSYIYMLRTHEVFNGLVF